MQSSVVYAAGFSITNSVSMAFFQLIQLNLDYDSTGLSSSTCSINGIKWHRLLT